MFLTIHEMVVSSENDHKNLLHVINFSKFKWKLPQCECIAVHLQTELVYTFCCETMLVGQWGSEKETYTIVHW